MPAPRTFTGRQEEREALGQLLDRATAGHGGSLVVLGDAGIGKSSLVEVIADEREATMACSSSSVGGGFDFDSCGTRRSNAATSALFRAVAPWNITRLRL